MNSIYTNLVAHVSKAMFSDDYDQSEMLADIYLSANQAEKDVLDRAFTCLCGWSCRPRHAARAKTTPPVE